MDAIQSATPLALPEIDDTASTGWDARTVWRERVRNPQAGRSRGEDAGGSGGWDPLEIWRQRVQRPRKSRA